MQKQQEGEKEREREGSHIEEEEDKGAERCGISLFAKLSGFYQPQSAAKLIEIEMGKRELELFLRKCSTVRFQLKFKLCKDNNILTKKFIAMISNTFKIFV